MQNYIVSILSFCAILALAPDSSQASPVPGTIQRTFLSPDRPNSQNYFGWDIAVYNNTFFASDPFTPEGGAVYQFDRNGSLLRKIYYPGTGAQPRFGDGITIIGDHLVVGATYDQSSAPLGGAPGAVYVFSAATGAFERRIDSPSPTGTFQEFGRSFAQKGNQLVIGNANHSVPVFNVDTGQLIREFSSLHPNDGYFGEELAIVNDQLFISAPQQSHSGNAGKGVIYAFDINTGTQIRSIGDNLTATNRLGTALTTSASGDVLAGDFDTQNPSHAFVFDDASGSLLRTYTQPVGTQGAWYGVPVGSIGPYDLVSTYTFQRPGAVYFYDLAGQSVLTIGAPIQVTSRNFAKSLAAWGSELLVGAPDNANGTYGIVYLFSTPVPEPSSCSLGLIAAGALAYIAHRRKKQPTVRLRSAHS